MLTAVDMKHDKNNILIYFNSELLSYTHSTSSPAQPVVVAVAASTLHVLILNIDFVPR